MTTIRAHVRRAQVGDWFAHVHVVDGDGELLALRSSMAKGSHAEAMQAAHKMLADLDAELMAEVHDSRAARRATANDPPRASLPSLPNGLEAPKGRPRE